LSQAFALVFFHTKSVDERKYLGRARTPLYRNAIQFESGKARCKSSTADDGWHAVEFDWLKPFTHTRECKAGENIFSKGDVATNLMFVVRGKFKLIELGIELASGALIGELGLLSPDNRRTQTPECISDGELLVISYDEVRQLQVQNPSFGLYFLQLASSRMFQNMQRLEAELARYRAS
jgi:signal-transduction protein with cAMP-binding, CBS, and nucleotidyltransferase domain